MKSLVAEDDFASRKFITNYLKQFGECDATVDGMEVVDAFMMAHEDEAPYDLICLDVMMPAMDGYQALKTIRNIEEEKGIPVKERAKIVMMTALNEERNVKKAFEMGCTVYCAKPIDIDKLEEVLQKLSLI